jgi:hypothetical protein
MFLWGLAEKNALWNFQGLDRTPCQSAKCAFTFGKKPLFAKANIVYLIN